MADIISNISRSAATANVVTGGKGDPGKDGDPGLISSLTIGTVTVGDVASAAIVGEPGDQKLNLVLKNGIDGIDGTNGSIVSIQNNNWFINDIDTGIKALAVDGRDGLELVVNGKTPVDGHVDIDTADMTEALGRVFVTEDQKANIHAPHSDDQDLSGLLKIDQTTPQTMVGTFTFPQVATPIIKPSADSASSIGLYKADGTTRIINVDTTNNRVSFGNSLPVHKLTVSDTTISNSLRSTFIGSAAFAGSGGGSNSGVHVIAANDTAVGDRPVVGAIRSGGTLTSPTTVIDGMQLFSFLAAAFDGSNLQYPSQIDFMVDGTVSAGSVPTSILFYTGAASGSRAVRMYISPTGNVALGSVSPTHSLTFPSTSTGIAIYNTVDQTTNFERFRTYYSGNVFYLDSQNSGTGTSREVRFGVSGGVYKYGSDSNTYLQAYAGSGLARMNMACGTITNNATGLSISSSLNASSGSNLGVAILPAITQTGTAGYTALNISVTETSVGSGDKNLIDAKIGGVSVFKVGAGAASSTGGRGYLNVINPTADAAGAGILFTTNTSVVGLFQLDGGGHMVFRNRINAGKHLYFDANSDVIFRTNSSSSVTTLTVKSSGVMVPFQAATASAPAYVKGGIYFDTTLNKLRVGGATGWETITSA